MLWRGPEAEVLPLVSNWALVRSVESARCAVSDGLDRRQHTVRAGDIRALEPRFSPENLPHNLQLVALVRQWAERKQATPSEIALAWVAGPEAVDCSDSQAQPRWRTCSENIGGPGVRFSSKEMAELDAGVRAIENPWGSPSGSGADLSGVEAPPRK